MRANQLGAIALGLAIAFVITAESARAAEFQLVQDNSSQSSTPADNSPPCQDNATTTAGAGGSMALASASASFDAQANGSDPGCNQSANAVADGVARFLLAPTMAESPGDPVTVCVEVEHDTNVASTGAGSASQTTHRSIASIQGGVVLVAVPEQSSSTEGNDQELNTFLCRREVVMTIGQQLNLSTGGDGKVSISGVGTAASAGQHAISAFVGECENDVLECPIVLDSPAFSSLALSVLGLLLPAGGALALRRRRPQPVA